MKKIIETINKHKKFLLISHENPDGDAVGSVLGLYFGLKKIKKLVFPVLPDPVPKIYSFLKGTENINNDFELDDIEVAIVLDCADIGRVENLKRKLTKIPKKINIDHHPSNFSFGEINYIDPKSSSTSELVLKILKRLNIEIDKDIAYALYTGLMTDTGGFRFANTNLNTFKAATFLVKKGANPFYISEMVYSMKPLKALKLLGRALEKLKKENGIIYSILTLEDFKEFGAEEEDAEGIVEYLNKSNEANISILFKQKNNGFYKVSLRSKGDNDVKNIALKFGGGGHMNAAGFDIKDDPKIILEKIILELKNK
ncbi:MAG: bifunctional oligoribonuclease/PAP phosphatase NrnA [Caldisericia bacterium]|nr:bifunctional oligoribonuclease/PAP phosphatase NrnA [Caldisericia bacterium]